VNRAKPVRPARAFGQSGPRSATHDGAKGEPHVILSTTLQRRNTGSRTQSVRQCRRVVHGHPCSRQPLIRRASSLPIPGMRERWEMRRNLQLRHSHGFYASRMVACRATACGGRQLSLRRSDRCQSAISAAGAIGRSLGRHGTVASENRPRALPGPGFVSVARSFAVGLSAMTARST
jgi:hypothetical protein